MAPSIHGANKPPYRLLPLVWGPLDFIWMAVHEPPPWPPILSFINTFVSHASQTGRNEKKVLLLPAKMLHDEIVATAAREVTGHLRCVTSLKTVIECSASPNTTIPECPTAGRGHPDRSLAPTTLHPRCPTIWTPPCSMETPPPLSRL